MRYLQENFKKDLNKKLCFLSGPRQVGKSTLVKSFMSGKSQYLNWDIKKDQKVIRDLAWGKESDLVIFDELHKYSKWKNFLKGVIDEYGNKPKIIVTGSAKLETFRKAGDALTGRSYHYRLHPFDVKELLKLKIAKNPDEALEKLLITGGFPEAFFNPKDSLRLLNDRLNLVLREDLQDLSQVGKLRDVELLVELLRERVGGQISYSNLAQDISVSSPTVKNWIDILERLYLVFTIKPYYKNMARAIRKEPKIFFFDSSAAYNTKETDGVGAKLENIVALALLKECNYQEDVFGRKLRLSYFRDKDHREVDFVVTEGAKVLLVLEVKSKEDRPTTSLKYLTSRLKPDSAVLLTQGTNRLQEVGEIIVAPISKWLSNFSL